MASVIRFSFSLLLLIFLPCFISNCHGSHFHILQASSLLPASVCTPSITKGRQSTMKVFHRHGPCFRVAGKKAATTTSTATQPPSLSEVISQDQMRVDSIQARLSPNAKTVNERKANVPVKSGRSLGSGNYLVTVGIGTPARTLALIIDTGSDLTWTQCEPCAGSCYEQEGPIFNPSASSSYSNISCNSAQCYQLSSATGNSPGCLSRTTCIYMVRYGDESTTVGFLSKDKLTITATDVVPNFVFGCGQNNKGLFGSTSGLLGLGRDPLSVVSQTSQKYNNHFSYCLPSTPSSTGHLTLGESVVSSNVKFTPFSSSRGTSYYFVEILAISVGRLQLPISPSVFNTAGTIIDSGTVITRLPPDAYSAMSSAFKQHMTKYPSAPAYSILDTCFDFSNFTTLTIPTIGFTFGGNVKVDLHPQGILMAVSSSTACLAFAGNNDANSVGIFGNTQQKTLEVVYDVAGGNLGFSPGGCS